MIRGLVLTLALIGPAGVWAEGGGIPADADIASLTVALADHGCVLDTMSADAVLAQSGLEPEAATAVVQHLTAEGHLVRAGDSERLVLIGFGCPAD